MIWENLQTNPVTGFELVGRCEAARFPSRRRVNVDHRYCGAVCLLVANDAHHELGDLFEPHSGVGRDQRRPGKRRAYAWPAVF